MSNRFTANMIGFQTILIREIKRILRIWMQTLLPPAITMTLYFIIFGTLIGARIGNMEGFNYMQYIAPGLITILMAMWCHHFSALNSVGILKSYWCRLCPIT